jgi:hypothetical protein
MLIRAPLRATLGKKRGPDKRSPMVMEEMKSKRVILASSL